MIDLMFQWLMSLPSPLAMWHSVAGNGDEVTILAVIAAGALVIFLLLAQLAKPRQRR
jgi:bacteriorhodopsin